ncbi:hypothetical protein GWK47_007886 [Chionoecetes opilio]|uniref:DUF7041 domain-containing protein n=1 Tax=Chionoecetes opilio TaxID=41210 RepID=A0A8J4YAU5_CHIOP|nr:hypothetical protein GWK47_007886 [Chionoecetes opilio]
MDTNSKPLRLPAFTSDIATWLMHLEASWAGSPEITDLHKFQALVRAIPSDVAACISSVLTAPLADGKYEAFKTALVRALGRSCEAHVAELDTLQYDGRRPSAFLSRMQDLNRAEGSHCPRLCFGTATPASCPTPSAYTWRVYGARSPSTNTRSSLTTFTRPTPRSPLLCSPTTPVPAAPPTGSGRPRCLPQVTPLPAPRNSSERWRDPEREAAMAMPWRTALERTAASSTWLPPFSD